MRGLVTNPVSFLSILFCLYVVAYGQATGFHGAPASVKDRKAPLAVGSGESGKPLYKSDCASCHGTAGEGSGNVPSLTTATIKAASAGELFWFISKGDPNNGMPSWEQLSETQRWQIVGYLKALKPVGVSAPAAADVETPSEVVPAPKPPFTDYRFEKPGQIHKITLKDLPLPFETTSAGNGPTIVPKPQNAWPKAPSGFQVTLYAATHADPRRIRRAPNGDLFVSEVNAGKVEIFRGVDKAGRPLHRSVFASGLDRPFGVNFYPPGRDPRWVYVGTTNTLLRFPYRNGDLQARGTSEHIMEFPREGHANRDIVFPPGGRKILVAIGSFSNADDADQPSEKNRADILECDPDGSDLRVYAYGIRNPSFLALEPKTNKLWTTVNERDGLGDNLVPDYITPVQRGGFYGWPWWYMGGHQDPRLAGKHPELKDKVLSPDVLLQPHNASVGLAFYDGKQFPPEFRGDIFAAEHGSWNRSVRAGYEVIRVPLHQTGNATGEYEDFLTGFVIDNKRVWGRPSGVAVGADGSLFVVDDVSGSIWRVSYVGK